MVPLHTGYVKIITKKTSMSFIDNLIEKIKNSRDLKQSSVSAYVTHLLKLHEMIAGDRDMQSLDFLNDYNAVLKSIEQLKLNTRKTYLASIVVALSATNDYNNKLLSKYRQEMTALIDEYNTETEKQLKSDVQEDNWVTMATLRRVMRRYRAELVDRRIFHKEPDALTVREFDLLQKFVVSALYVISEDNAPLRLDYAGMQVIKKSDFDDLKADVRSSQNYLVIVSNKSKFFHLSDYKTVKTYKVQQINVGPKLNQVLNIWLKFNTSGHLLVNLQGKPMTKNYLTKYLNKVFSPTDKKNISANMIRHIFISERFPAKLQEKQNVAQKMLHSTSTQEKYSKR